MEDHLSQQHGKGQLHADQAVTGTGVTAFECTIAVEDVAATAEAIETHGGQLTMQPFEIEHVGTLVMFKDTEGNTVGAMQYCLAFVSWKTMHQNPERIQSADSGSGGEYLLVLLTQTGP